MKKLVFSLFVCGFVLAGCKNEPTVAPDGDRQIVVFFSAQSVSASLLKAAGDIDETISKVILFGVDGQDVVAIDDPILEGTDLDNALDAGTEVTLSKRIKWLYAVANPSDDLETALGTTPPSTLGDLLALTDDFTEAPDPSSLLMGGKGQINPTAKSVKIDLLRAVAKVEIIGLNLFEITSVQVTKTPDKGYVFEQSPFSIPDNTPVNYTKVESPDDMIFYVAENELPGTEFVVTGTFDSKQATYTIKTLKVEGVSHNIVRNTYYKIGLSPLTEDNFTVTIEITDWTPVEVDDQYIPDDNFI